MWLCSVHDEEPTCAAATVATAAAVAAGGGFFSSPSETHPGLGIHIPTAALLLFIIMSSLISTTNQPYTLRHQNHIDT